MAVAVASRCLFVVWVVTARWDAGETGGWAAMAFWVDLGVFEVVLGGCDGFGGLRRRYLGKAAEFRSSPMTALPRRWAHGQPSASPSTSTTSLPPSPGLVGHSSTPSSGLAGLGSFHRAPPSPSSGSYAEPSTSETSIAKHNLSTAELRPRWPQLLALSSAITELRLLRRSQPPLSSHLHLAEHDIHHRAQATPGIDLPVPLSGSHPSAIITFEAVHLSSLDVGHASLRQTHSLSTSM
ncbi:hypothetical protein Dimus_003430 [Dionaea muscipula]